MSYTNPLSERLFAMIDVAGDDDCWEWTGSKKGRYGQIIMPTPKGWRPKPAHRVAWEVANGRTMPSHLDACHHCDNPGCCNPKHIFPGSARDNMQDASTKGRCAGQAKTHCSKGHEFTEDNIYHPPSRPRVRICRECRREGIRVSQKNRRSKLRAAGLSARGRPLKRGG